MLHGVADGSYSPSKHEKIGTVSKGEEGAMQVSQLREEATL